MVNDTEPGVMPGLVLWRGVVRNSSQVAFDAFGARVPSVRVRSYDALDPEAAATEVLAARIHALTDDIRSAIPTP